MNYDQMFPSRFIKAGEFEGKPVTLTIGAVEREGLERDDGHEEMAAILTFREKRKNGDPIQMVLNKTNAQAIFAMWPDTQEWAGKRVTFFPEPDDSGMSDSGFRIRVQGSPDIDKAITYQLKLPRRKPRQCRLIKTVAGARTPEPEYDRETGEVPDEPDIPDAVDEPAAEPTPNEDDALGFGLTGEVVGAELAYKAALKKSTLPKAKQDSALALMDANRAAAEMKGDFDSYVEWLQAQTARVPGAES